MLNNVLTGVQCGDSSSAYTELSICWVSVPGAALGCLAELLLCELALNLVCSSCHVQKGLITAIP